MKFTVIFSLLATLSVSLAETRKDPGPKMDRPSGIVGGKDVGKEYEFSGRVLVRKPASRDAWSNDDIFYGCTGTLIHRRWILTAAHCLEEDTTYRDVAICLLPNGCEGSEWKQASAVEVRGKWEWPEENDEGISWYNSQFDQALIRLRYSESSMSTGGDLQPDCWRGLHWSNRGLGVYPVES